MALALNEFQLSIEEGNGVVRLALAGEFDLAAAEEFERELERVETGGASAIVIDLRDLTFIDSTGLQMMLKADTRSRQNGFRLAIVRGPKNVQRVFEITGTEEHLPMIDDPSQLL